MMEMTNCNSSIFPCGFSQILKLIGTYIFLRRNSQFSHGTITESLISSMNYENGRFGTQTFASGSVLSLNYENGRFGPQTFASDLNSPLSDSQIPFLPFYPTR
jgi:hypothetical protein